MCKKQELVIVYVYCNKNLIKYEKFTSLNSAHRFAEYQLLMGNSCNVQRLENGRVWSTLSFRPKESI